MSHQTMYDAVTVHAIPHDDTPLRAAYVDGNYANHHAMHLRFPHKRIVGITVTPTVSAQILDVEQGDATPHQAAQWAHDEASVKRVRTIYCNLSTFKPVCEALHENGLDADDVNFWLAHPTGEEHICTEHCWAEYGELPFTPHVVGTQYAWPGHGSPGDYDISAMVEGWPDIAPEHHEHAEAHIAETVQEHPATVPTFVTPSQEEQS